MLRKLFVPLCLVVAVSGCPCGNTPPDLTVAITSPKDGASLTMADDVANDVNGLQIAVAATTVNFDTAATASLLVDGIASGTAQPIAADGTTSFAQVTLTKGSHVLKVTATGKDGTAESTPVSVVADDTPLNASLSIVAPTEGAVLNIKSDISSEAGLQTDVNVKSVGLSGGQVRICVTAPGLTGDACKKAPGQSVNGTGDLLATGNLTSIKVTLPDGTGEVIAAEHEAADGTITVATAVTVTVDTKAPTISGLSLIDGSTLVSQNQTITLNVGDAEAGDTVTVTSSADSSVQCQGTVTAGGQVSVSCILPTGPQTVTVTVSDKAGNSTSTSVNVTVNIVGCAVVPTDPSTGALVVNIANGSPTGSPATGTYTLKGKTSNCAGGTAHFSKTLGGNTAEVGTAAVGSDGTFSYPMSFTDGEVDATITIVIAKDGTATNAGVQVPYLADFTAPQLDDAIPALGNLFVVNAANPHLATHDVGYFADADPATAGGQVDVVLTVEGVGNKATMGSLGNLLGRVVITAGSTTIFDQTYQNNGKQTVPATPRITLPEGYSGDVIITLTDEAKNTATGIWHAKVSTLAMPTLTFSPPPPSTLNALNDSGGDLSTYGVIQALVNYSSAVPSGAQVLVCTTIAGTLNLGSCPGYPAMFALGNPLTASGTSQYFGGLKLPEGAQDLYAVMSDAVGELNKSGAVHILVDTKPPKVLTLVSTDDASPKDNIVSGAELAPSADATFTVTFDGVEDGQQPTLNENGKAIVTNPASVTVSNNTATFVIPGGLSDGVHTLKVLVKDAASNPNENAASPTIANSTDSLTITFARNAPSISVVAPTFNICNIANEKSNSPNGFCNVDFTVAVGTSADHVDFFVTGNGNSISSPTVTSASFVNGQATTTYSLTQTTTPVTFTAKVYDLAGNFQSATSVMHLVDTIAPHLTITSPSDHATVLAQKFPVTISTDAEDGQQVTVTSDANAPAVTVVGTGTAASGTATFNANIPAVASQKLTASVSDAAQNPSAPYTITITLQVSGCPITFTNPQGANPILNATSAPNGKVHITAYTLPACASAEFDFTATGGSSGTKQFSENADSGGNIAFDYTFDDGSQTTLEAVSAVAQSTPNGFTAIVDYTPPTLSVTAPVPNSSNQLFVVAASGNIHIKSGGNDPGYYADLNSQLPDGQAAIVFTAGGAGPSAGVGTGSIQILQGGNIVYPPTPQPISDNNAHVLSPIVTLSPGLQQTLTVVATDYAGNTASQTYSLTVDVDPPTAPSIVTSDPGNHKYTQATSPRGANFEFDFNVQSDTGPGSQPLTWQGGYATGTSLGTAGFDVTAFGNSAVTTSLGPGTIASTGGPVSIPVGPIPPLDTYYFGARVLDEVGNTSSLSTTSLTPWTEYEINYPGTPVGGSSFGYTIVGGDIDGDGKDDYAISAPDAQGEAGAVFVYFGGTFPPTPAITINGRTSSSNLGVFMALHDVTGDKHADLLVQDGTDILLFIAKQVGTSNSWTFGTSPDYVFTGPAGAFLNVTTLPSIDSDTIAEVAIADYQAASGAGQVYIFPGRSDWSSLASGGNTPPTIPLSSADITITGADPGGGIGVTSAFVGLPAIDGKGKGELVVPALFANTVYLFPGSVLMAGKPALSTATAGVIGPFTASGAVEFGSAAAAIDINGDSLPDLVIGDFGQDAIFAFTQNADHTFTLSASQPWATNSANFGANLSSGLIDTDSRPDLVAGVATDRAGTVSLFSSQSSKVSPASPVILSGPLTYGDAISTFDVNGDGFADIAVGIPSGGTDGKVRIRF